MQKTANYGTLKFRGLVIATSMVGLYDESCLPAFEQLPLANYYYFSYFKDLLPNVLRADKDVVYSLAKKRCRDVSVLIGG